MKHEWTKLDRWDLEDAADGACLMIVQDEAGGKYLLCKLRPHPALPATWCMAIEVKPTDTRETLEADAGCVCPMSVWNRATEGYDDERPIMYNWPSDLVRNIADAAEWERS